MSHTTHTPGPWNACHDRTVASSGVPLLRLYAGRNERANANLVAAAPELLEALEKAIKSYWLSIDYAHNRTPEACEIRREMLAAIAKAKEETK